LADPTSGQTDPDQLFDAGAGADSAVAAVERTLTKQNFLQYIQQQTRAVSQTRYSDPRQQCLYELGLCQAILAECMHMDNLAASTFHRRISEILAQRQ
jgi:hypothetical protein